MYLDIYFMVKDTPPRGRGLLYNLVNFDETYFMEEWYIAYDRLGDGCKVDSLIRIE